MPPETICSSEPFGGGMAWSDLKIPGGEEQIEVVQGSSEYAKISGMTMISNVQGLNELPLKEPDLFQGVRLLWLRLERPQGMALARSMGGDSARGEAIATWQQGLFVEKF